MSRRSVARLRVLSLAVVLLLTLGCDRSPPGPLTVAEVASPAAEGSGQPKLAVGPDGEVVLSWLEPTADGPPKVPAVARRKGHAGLGLPKANFPELEEEEEEMEEEPLEPERPTLH